MNRKLLGVAVALFAGAALAQTGNTGSVTLQGRVARTVSISNTTATYVAPGSGPVAVFGAATSPVAFDIDWNFDDINLMTPTDTAANGSSVRLMLTFDMRSNAGYALTAQAAEQLGGASVLAPTAIGFCTKTLATSTNTARVQLPRADAPVFDCRSTVNGTYDAVADQITYTSTLADIDDPVTPTSVLTGNQISTGGTNNSPNNYITVGTEFAFRPELFLTQGNFSYTVTFTASNP